MKPERVERCRSRHPERRWRFTRRFERRNGIPAADSALTGGRHQCEIWRGCAKRGLGASASQGDPNNHSDDGCIFIPSMGRGF
ncbi:MAG: M36 family metallopeptidase [Acidobacteria bacterium]|nr:M36 family metallopeptidase [Acidobacteriota bacterium]